MKEVKYHYWLQKTTIITLRDKLGKYASKSYIVKNMKHAFDWLKLLLKILPETHVMPEINEALLLYQPLTIWGWW